MIRLRRYRVFLGIAVFLLLGLYYLIDARGWGGRSSLASKNARPDTAFLDETPVESDSRGRKTHKDSPFKNSKSDSQVALDEDEGPGSRGKTRGSSKSKGKLYEDEDALEFPHKKPSDDASIDERLPRGKHDPSPTTTNTVKPPRFTKQPENFPVPDELVIKLPTGAPKAIPKIQHDFPRESSTERKARREKLRKLKKTFLKHWGGYKEYAWDHDELRPTSGGYQDPFAGWRATLVDTLDTLWIMGLKEEFEEAVEEVATIDFKTTQKMILPLFEVAIRYMGGLIAAYDISDMRYSVLLDKAEELAEVLVGAFDTPNRMPVTMFHWHNEQRKAPSVGQMSTVLAEIGSLTMEFTRLAQITKNDRYYDLVARITDEFDIFQNQTKVPGLWPLNVDASGGCSAGEITKEWLEAETGVEISNKGTVNDVGVGRGSSSGMHNHLAKDDAPTAGNPPRMNAMSQKDKSSFGQDSDEALHVKASNPRNPAKDAFAKNLEMASKEQDSWDSWRDKKAQQQADSSLKKRAPPKYDELEDIKAGKSKRPPSTDEDEDADTIRSTSQKKSSSSDETRRRPSSEDVDEIGHRGKSSFADDVSEEPERPHSKSTDHSSNSALTNHYSDEDSEYSSASKAAKSASNKKSSDDADYHDETKAKDKSSFGADSASHRKVSSPDYSAMHKESHKDHSSFGDDSDVTSTAAFRHNKPMHKCVKRGLRSTYGDSGMDKFTFGGMADSVYEYLPKTFLLLGGLEPQYRRMHEKAMEAMRQYLLFRAMTPETKREVWLTGDFTSQGFEDGETGLMRGTFVPHTGHLTCFQGAFIGLAARAFRNEKDVGLARRLTDGCIWAYEQMPTGIMPELFDTVTCANLTGPCEFNETAWWNGIDPWAKDKVAVYQQMAAETDQDTIAAAKGNVRGSSGSSGSTGSTLGTSNANKYDVDSGFDSIQKRSDTEPTKVQAERVWDSLIGRAKPDPNMPSQLDHMADKRRPPEQLPHQQTPEEAKESILAQPTSIPEYMERQIKQIRLVPGMTKMNAREYILRPEAIESVFYMWRITGDPYFREKGWQMFEAIDNATSTTHGNSAIQDVSVDKNHVVQRDKAESFWTAETLKYFWLLFSEPDVVSLDDWVFNTEAHPFRRPELDNKRNKAAEQVRRRKGMGGGMVWDLD